MTDRRNDPAGDGAGRGDMRTPRRPRLTRRQSEQLLDHLDGADDLARLLSTAGRAPAAGELPGEAAVLLAYRRSAVTSPDPDTRSQPVRTLSLRRSLVIKVLATTTAAVAFGGVAVAATGHFPAVPSLSATAAAAHPSVTPTGTPGTAKDATRKAAPTARPSDPARHREAVAYLGLCRAWAESSRRTSEPMAKSTAFQELAATAGGTARVAAHCEQLVQQWCTDHAWPDTASTTYAGRPYTFHCLAPKRAGAPTATPVRPPHPVLPPVTGKPVVPPSRLPIVLPTGAPVRS